MTISNAMNNNVAANALSQSSSYTDLNKLNEIKGKGNSEEGMRAVAQQFESLFVKMMMQSMRDANKVFGEGNFDQSFETEFYRDMLDTQLSTTLSETGGIGLADVIYKQLTRYLDVGQDRSKGGPFPISPSHSEPVPREEAKPSAPALETESVTGGLPDFTAFEGAREFIDTLLPMAEKAAAVIGVDPRVLLAQSALETGWGKYITANEQRSSNNLFNIKADSRWQGESVSVNTLEYRGGEPVRERADFRAYDSLEDSFNDYVDFLQRNARYEDAMAVSHEPREFLAELQKAGYATDPEYANKILRIMNTGIDLVSGP